MNIRIEVLIALATLVLWPACGVAAPLSTLPPVVADHLLAMHTACAEADGTPDGSGDSASGFLFYRDDLIEHVVLDQVHTEIWILDEGLYQCEGFMSLFSGSGGAQIYFFARQQDGRVEQVLQVGANGYSLTKKGEYAKIWLNVGGAWCGDPNFKCNACAKRCRRPLEWNTKKGALVFAPLSQAKTLGD